MADEMTITRQGTLAQADDVQIPLTVGMLARRLAAKFPEGDAEHWDVYGMTVGDPDAEITRVAVALDATVSNVQRAASVGANVLVTHHPAFLDFPERLQPAPTMPAPGGILWEAVTQGVAIMSFHTALDAQPAANALLPNMLNLSAGEVFKPIEAGSGKGFGRICAPKEDDALTLGALASRCTAIFGIQPRVWGDFSAKLSRIVTWGGGLGSAVEAADLPGLDCIVCGEVKYNTALDLAEAGVGVIELGHDVSEMPLTLLLATAVQDCGVDQAAIHLLDRGAHWTLPETIRV